LFRAELVIYEVLDLLFLKSFKISNQLKKGSLIHIQ